MGIFGAVQIVKERQVSEKEAFLRNISVRGGWGGGGVGVTVEIDESKWGYKRKYNRGRLVKEGIWIFGIIERLFVALFTCSGRSAGELIPKINRVVLPGTCIMSDEWAAYRSLS